ncbi:hypothetical protein WJX74_007512 [Apatococcus lobatus]|uniref:HP domain-containing protein n=2 Tax=Apatococcus TaxID=904362 RepID=A0AAW1TBF1_9CHLO
MADSKTRVPSLQELCELLIARQVSVRSVLEWLEVLKDDPVLTQCEMSRLLCHRKTLVGSAEARAQAKRQMQVRGMVVERKAADSKAPAVAGTLALQELQEGVVWPPGVDPSLREVYLRDDDFSSTFHMSRSEFKGLAKWKQIQLKKRAGLF